ncbi:MAG: site-2 protease family protein [Gemmatimonadota bacterium]|nr:site-2 protease family protein [Gemmatimonadota bacterium]
MEQLTDAVVYFTVFLLSTTLHEAAHAWAAMRGGDLTAYHGGQVSLDPTAHIRREPFGMVILPVITALLTGWPIGYASAPYDPEWAVRHPKRAALMALAGPAANLLLVLFAVALLRLGVARGVLYPPEHIRFGHVTASDAGGYWSSIATLVGAFFSVNVLLATFNLLPLPPLDGSGALPLVLSANATRRYQKFLWSNPALGWVGMFAAWKLFGYLFTPLFVGAVNLLYPGASYH